MSSGAGDVTMGIPSSSGDVDMWGPSPGSNIAERPIIRLKRRPSGPSGPNIQPTLSRKRSAEKSILTGIEISVEPLTSFEPRYDDFELEDLIEYFNSAIQPFIEDIGPAESSGYSSLEVAIEHFRKSVITPGSPLIPPLKKWIVDQIGNGKFPLLQNGLDPRELRNISLYDYYIATTPNEKLNNLLLCITVFILASRTGDYSIFTNDEMKSLLN